ncbi:KPN_02809 family neutral zinc metallopeptidase [Vagococcus intermedius]|uniref:Zinc metallopeptidase n=1 Tax=Vagococcus intermedius TaxID=2991418 RepID=A0AAF0I6L7_9ENTE|nr:neutral zinc metallopeptidase [Vagococcus intermedius]WEG72809.1 zinc metallopeptidase [Vagococcus intermedius]WEG74895.1 zinc metallopeptidase [Vagococcus intermedius]
MKWRGGRQSNNVEDQTGRQSNRNVTGGGINGLPIGLLRGGGLGSVIIVILFFLFSGGDLTSMIGEPQTSAPRSSVTQTQSKADPERKEFVSVVFGHLEDYWGQAFAEKGQTYEQPKMVLYDGQVRTACGAADSSVGPFYCPGDKKVYLDLSFMDELVTKFKASGDFAMAYVVAHEVGHHVQEQLGVSDQMNRLRRQLPEKDYNKYQVRMELQADYYAGVWTRYIDGKTFNNQPILDVGDIDEALVAANSIGDDTLQRKFQGFVVPDSFTHGTSKQRKNWFYRGFEYGDFEHGDTFNAPNLDLN